MSEWAVPSRTRWTHEDLHLFVQAVVHDERVRHAHTVRLHRVTRAIVCVGEAGKRETKRGRVRCGRCQPTGQAGG